MIDTRIIRKVSVFALTFFLLVSLQPTHATASPSAGDDLYQKWLTEDVAWIISDQERSDFKKLSTSQQRKDFVIAFWDRRNPTPGAETNTFKEEHYRRLAYANKHFAEGMPGWETDRGRFYVSYGPPDSIETLTNSQPGTFQKSCSGEEDWKWNYVGSLGHPLGVKFVEVCDDGGSHWRISRNGPPIR